MTDPAAVSRADFDALCRLQNLTMLPGEADRLFEAYKKLRVLLARIPYDGDIFEEPSPVWAPGVRRLSR